MFLNSILVCTDRCKANRTERIPTRSHTHSSHQKKTPVLDGQDPNPSCRYGHGTRGVDRIQKHPFFEGLDFSHIPHCVPPIIPRATYTFDACSSVSVVYFFPFFCFSFAPSHILSPSSWTTAPRAPWSAKCTREICCTRWALTAPRSWISTP